MTFVSTAAKGAASGGSQELSYVTGNATANITGTSSGTANTLLTSASIAFDGVSSYWIEFFAPGRQALHASTGQALTFGVWIDSTLLALNGQDLSQNGTAIPAFGPFYAKHKVSPSAGTHTVSVKAWNSAAGTALVVAGLQTGGDNAFMWLRVTTA